MEPDFESWQAFLAKRAQGPTEPSKRYKGSRSRKSTERCTCEDYPCCGHDASQRSYRQ